MNMSMTTHLNEQYLMNNKHQTN